MNDPKGSIWRIWDLHVHTPESIVQRYGPRNEDTWEKYLTEIESLPSNIRVLGINDYIFLEGYKRIIAERKKGRLNNIDLVLPVIELRIDKFGGTDSNLSRVNFHVIFSDELDLETIEGQFINALSTHYILSANLEKKSWSGVPTKASLEDLGNKIIRSVPENERRNFASPLTEGFNNLSLSFENVRKLLDGPYFNGKVITAVGKTEWWNIKWNDKSIADKKTIINYSDIVFTASEDIKSFYKSKESLKNASVNDKLLDCSDSHSFSLSSEKDRLGNCFTWIKADPTFNGLKQSIIEFEERVFVGNVPPQIDAVAKNKTKYIQSISVKKVNDSRKALNETWFNADIPINNGLVSIIGNKGSGKSALGDVLGLLGNSNQYDHFSFLRGDKFKKMPENKAKYFEAKLQWESGEAISKKLDSQKDGIERIKYIPQNYFEEICTQLGGIEETAFDKELKNVIFSHVNRAERLEKRNLDELINFKSGEIEEAILSAKQKLGKINRDISEAEIMLTDENRDRIEKQILLKKDELNTTKKSKPKAIKKPSNKTSQISEILKKEKKRRDDVKDEIQKAKESQSLLARNISLINKLEGKLDNLDNMVSEFYESSVEISSKIELDIKKIVKVTVDRKPLSELREKVANEKSRVDDLLEKDKNNSLYAKLDTLEASIKSIQEKLDKPSKNYQKYLEELADWEQRIKEIEGNPGESGSIHHLNFELKELTQLPEKLEKLKEQRVVYARKIYKQIKKQKNVLQELYSPVQKFISENPEIGSKIDLNFGASLMNIGFSDGLFSFLNLGKAKSFTGVDGKTILSNAINQYNFDDENDSINFAEEINNLLHFNKGEKQNQLRVDEQLKQGQAVDELYNFLYSFEYLQARYILKLGEKELRQLSPGERGALLIVFYLLVDLETIPLIIDQPEHNLDNETITRLLVPAIKKAKARRQIIIITHNPILAVVCNSDQIIVAALDIKSNYKLEYLTGAIENRAINKKIVDILEGTILSFDNREKKYIREYLDSMN